MTLTYEQYSRHLASLDQQEIQARVDGDEEKIKEIYDSRYKLHEAYKACHPEQNFEVKDDGVVFLSVNEIHQKGV